MTGAAFRRAIGGLFLHGSCDRSVSRSCCWQTRQRIGCYPLASLVPIEKNPQSLRWMWAEDYAQELSANKLLTTPVFVVCTDTANRKTGVVKRLFTAFLLINFCPHPSQTLRIFRWERGLRKVVLPAFLRDGRNDCDGCFGGIRFTVATVAAVARLICFQHHRSA